LFWDDFGSGALNGGRWIAHGDGVSVVAGSLRVESGYWWEDGVECVEHFNRPTDVRTRLAFTGRFKMAADSPRSAAIVHIQDHWGSGNYNAYTVEFAKDQDFDGDNRVFFGALVDGSTEEYLSVGEFTPGEWHTWKVSVCDTGCYLYLDGAYVHDSGVGSFALGVNLHGSGQTSYWDDIGVVEVDAPVPPLGH
jgi:hypothetical protein